MSINVNHELVRQQISNLKFTHPELLDDDEALIASLESETDLTELLTAVVRAIDDTKAKAIGTKDRLDELRARKERFEARIVSLRDLAVKMLEIAGINKIELPEATLSLRAAPPSVVITDEALVPDYCCKIERKPDKAKIKERLMIEDVPGATLSNGGMSLTLKVR